MSKAQGRRSGMSTCNWILRFSHVQDYLSRDESSSIQKQAETMKTIPLWLLRFDGFKLYGCFQNTPCSAFRKSYSNITAQPPFMLPIKKKSMTILRIGSSSHLYHGSWSLLGNTPPQLQFRRRKKKKLDLSITVLSSGVFI